MAQRKRRDRGRRGKREPHPGWRDLILRVCALAGLAGLCLLGLEQLTALRGELAAKRFGRLVRLLPRLDDRELRDDTVRNGMTEAELTLRFNRQRAHALWQVAGHTLAWSRRDDIDPTLRTRLVELAVQAAMLAVRAAPTDYEAWEFLARAHAADGLHYRALVCLRRARELAPVHNPPELLIGGVNILDLEDETRALIEQFTPAAP